MKSYSLSHMSLHSGEGIIAYQSLARRVRVRAKSFETGCSFDEDHDPK